MRRAALLVAVLIASGLVGQPFAQAPRATDLLDRYLRGDFTGVVATLETLTTFDDLLKQLREDGPAWMNAGGPAERPRRELAAATFALEAARVDEWREWKMRRKVPLPADETCIPKRAPEILIWQPPPMFIKWGFDLFARDAKPRPIERWWQLAALAVAERSEDFEFMSSDGLECIWNPEDEVDFVFHARKRFPAEPRFALAEGITEEWRRPQKAKPLFEALQRDIDVGAEATLRLGFLSARQRDDDRALSMYERVEPMTRDPWVIYLARYFKGQALERQKKPAEAERAYRGALAAVPLAQSASAALASLLFRTDRRAEANDVMDAMANATPPPADPWRGYADADDRFWPQLIGRLRAEIKK